MALDRQRGQVMPSTNLRLSLVRPFGFCLIASVKFHPIRMSLMVSGSIFSPDGPKDNEGMLKFG
jgi:hypothetical protein